MADDADTVEIFTEQIADIDAIGLLTDHEIEFEGNSLAIDFFVADAVAVGIDPASLVEQLFGLVKVLLDKGRVDFSGYIQESGEKMP